MTKKSLEQKFNVNIIHSGLLIRTKKYHAFRGGNGTGEPVIDIAEAYTLVTLAERIKRKLG